MTSATSATRHVDVDLTVSGELRRAAAATLDLTRPVAVLFLAVLGHVPTLRQARAAVTEIVSAVPSGSYIVMGDGTASAPSLAAAAAYAATGAAPYHPRTPDELNSLFTGLQPLAPGLGPVSRWRAPDQRGIVGVDHSWGGVARTP